MRTLCFFILAGLSASIASAGAFEELPDAGELPAVSAVPAPTAVEMPSVGGLKNAVPACLETMKGDRSGTCVIVTQKTTVCADGKKINTGRVTEKDVKAGKYDRSELGKYKDADLRAWSEYQKKLGKDGKWGDGSHQNILATGQVNPLQTAYVVLPNRAWLGRTVTVCAAATGLCTEAQALEVGPKTTFVDHSEVSVRTLMDLGLDANPNNGTHNGEITFTFH